MWTVRNLALFREMIKTQKIMSPAFPAGECSLRLSVYQSTVAGADFLSLCLESKVRLPTAMCVIPFFLAGQCDSMLRV